MKEWCKLLFLLREEEENNLPQITIHTGRLFFPSSLNLKNARNTILQTAIDLQEKIPSLQINFGMTVFIFYKKENH